MKSRIITIGDEILIGQIVDTNSAWIARELNAIGITVDQILSISDSRLSIHNALNDCPGNAEVVIMTGGLGPTADDITKPALAEWFECGWRVDMDVAKRVESHFALRGLEVPVASLAQAKVPDACELLENLNGTAPGMWFEKNNTIFISLPGVPFEMMSIFSDQVLPRLLKRGSSNAVLHKTIMTQGIGESTLMEIIADWERDLPNQGLKLAYLPSVGSVRLRLTMSGPCDRTMAQRNIDNAVGNVLPLISAYAYGFDDLPLEEAIGKLCSKYRLSIATAESCTGGYMAHLITSVPGSSAYFTGSVVGYANSAKVSALGVEASAIGSEGAVSETVARQMAEGVRMKFATDYGVSTTGIAGPDGGTADKPVGLVWIAVATPTHTSAFKFMMGNHRERNIRKTALQALQLLRKEVLKEIGLSERDALFV